MTLFAELAAGAIVTLIIATWFLGAITWGIMLWFALFGGTFRLKLNNPFKLLKKSRDA